MTALTTRRPVHEDVAAALGPVAAIKAAIELAEQPLAPLPDPTNGDAEFAAAVNKAKAALLVGEPIPTRIAQPVVAAIASSEEPGRRQIIRSQVLFELRSDLDTGYRANTDKALTVLGLRLDALLDDVQALASRLHGAQSEAEAAQLEAAIDEYDDIRSAQSALVTRALKLTSSGVPILPNTVMIWRTSIEYAKRWIQIRHQVRNNHRPTTDAATDYVEWMNSTTDVSTSWDTDQSRPWWPNSDTTGHLLWLAETRQAWVPTLPELRAAFTAASTAITAIGGRLAPNISTALRDYLQVTGSPTPDYLPAEPISVTPVNMMRVTKTSGRSGNRAARPFALR